MGKLTDYDSAEAWIRAAHEHPEPWSGWSRVHRDKPRAGAARRNGAAQPAAATGHHGWPRSSIGGNTTPVAEWNISVDPEAAAEEVFDAWAAPEPGMEC